ncbi:hypothetical protein SCLCIDRAFT_26860 [Scleroderma citrinum Foug A]|uniref:Uncharacterized protein n=1 Tax=Scleroderma citrinum Foug A TaxID=1036808 RepID=A0A0C3DHA6_9AGAM|nr:hypothetical protein SCLCIDRAFT_26860 [Scleroderma citrinum Foug A]
MDNLCQEYIHSGDYSQIWSILSKVEGLESRVCKLHWKNWDNSLDDPTKENFDHIRLISRILEELLMNAMEGIDMTQMYRWPERATALLDLLLDASLTLEQEKTLADAVTKRQQQLRQWLRWHAGAGKNRSANRKTLTIVDGLIKIKSDSPVNATDAKISTLREQIEKKFRVEPQEIQDEVMRIHNEQTTSKNTSLAEDEEETDLVADMEVHTSNIQQCAPALQQILGHLSRKTGWSFSVLMGGPDPMDAEGKCAVASLHIGKNQFGLNFAESYALFDSSLMQAYVEFLDSKYYTIESMPDPSLAASKKIGNSEDRDADNGNGEDRDADNGTDNEDNKDDSNDSNDDKPDDDGDSNEQDDAEISKDGKHGDAGDVDKLTGDAMAPVATTTLPRLAASATVATPYYPVAMHPTIASTPMHQNVASPVQQTIATPPRIATNGPTLAHALVSAFSAPQTMPPTLMPSIQPSNICNQLPSFSEFGSLGPELDLMFQAGSMGMFLDWTASTPQWSNNCLESNPFVAAGPTTVNMASQLLASSGMAPTVDYLTLATQVALELPQLSPTRSPQSRNELPLLPPAPSTDPNSPSDVFMECLQSFAYTGPGHQENEKVLI